MEALFKYESLRKVEIASKVEQEKVQIYISGKQ